MMQTHQQLLDTSREYNSLFSKNEFYPVQKAYTTPHFLVLVVRFPGKTMGIYLGRGHQYQGLFLSTKMPPSFLRVQDRFLDFVRKFIVGSRISKVEVDEKLNFFLFHFKNDHIDNTFVIGYKDRQLFFMKQSRDEVFVSFFGKTVFNEKIDNLIDQIQPDKHNELKDVEVDIDVYLDVEAKKISGTPIQKKREKFLEKKIKNIQNDLKLANCFNEIEEMLNNNELDLEQDEITLFHQRIKFFSSSNAWQKRDEVFKRIKKLKRGVDILKKRLIETEIELRNVQKGEFEFEVTKDKIIQPLWASSNSAKNKELPSKNIIIKEFKIKNLNGVISLNSQSNDWLRSNSSKEHYWFHVENHPGAHCVIKTDDFTQLAQDDLIVLASMIRDYSKLQILEIPIIYTQVKNLKGIKGVQGEVSVKKPKYLRCPYRNWKEIISFNEEI